MKRFMILFVLVTASLFIIGCGDDGINGKSGKNGERGPGGLMGTGGCDYNQIFESEPIIFIVRIEINFFKRLKI